MSFLISQGNGQSKVDSLRSQLDTETPDTARVETLNWLCFYFKDSIPATAEEYALEARQLALTINYSQGLLDANLNLGLLSFQADQLENAQRFYQDAYHQASTIYDRRGQALASFGIGRVLEQVENYTGSLEYFQKALTQARFLDNARLLGRIHYQVGLMNRSRGQYDLAKAHLDSALVIEKQLGNQYRQAETYFLLAIVQVHMGQYLEALKHSQQMQVIAEKLKDDFLLSQCYRAFGHVYGHVGNSPKALEVFERSLYHAKRGGTSLDVAIAKSNVGHTYRTLDSAQQAIQYLNEALLTLRQEGELRASSFSYYSLGSVYITLQAYDSAQAFLTQSLAISDSINAQRMRAAVLIEFGRMSIQQEQYREAIAYLTEAHSIAKQAAKPDYVRDAAQLLADAYQGQGNILAANQSLREYQGLADSLLNRNVYGKLGLQQAEFDFEKEKAAMELAKTEEALSHQAQLRERNFMQWLSIAALVICMTLVLVIARSFKIKKDAHTQLEDLNEEIQRSNQEIQQQNKEIKTQRDDLKSLVAAKDRFFSIISHDLRGPIHAFTSLSGLINHYLSEGKYEELHELVEALDTNSRNVAQLLDNLLSWAMHKQGLIAYKPEKIFLRKCTEEVFSLFQLKANDKQVKLDIQIAPGIVVWADNNALATIIRNLVSNALKFTHTHGTILVTAKQALPYIQITVQDTGIGIPEEQIGSLFRVDQKQVTKGTQGENGTGLGLPLVYDFVRMNQGDILVKSVPGVGTSFHILLPARQITPEEKEQKVAFNLDPTQSSDLGSPLMEHKKTGS